MIMNKLKINKSNHLKKIIYNNNIKKKKITLEKCF